jgi:sensor histidine kinase regulating citrate/malate metabolism
MSHCRELDINFNLVSSSSVPANSRFLSGNAFETLVGNLVENAIEAVNAKAKGDGEREVSLLVHEDEQALMITVDDTGEGMTEEEMERLKKGGYSSKGRYRGTGMRLIHSVLASSGGEMQIDSEKGVGTSISVCFTKEGKL